MNHFKQGQIIRIAQDSLISEWIEKEKTMYMRDRLSKPVIAIYLGRFFNEYMCKVIIGDKIRFVVDKDIREADNFKYHGINN